MVDRKPAFISVSVSLCVCLAAAALLERALYVTVSALLYNIGECQC